MIYYRAVAEVKMGGNLVVAIPPGNEANYFGFMLGKQFHLGSTWCSRPVHFFEMKPQVRG
jgi:hypothetical protein